MSLKSVQNGDEVLRKGPWMPEEDEILVEYVRQFGARDWSSIRTKGLLPRTGKSCRLRWVNKLKPDLKRSGCKFSPEEEKLVVEMQAKLGNKWAKIASCLPGRTDNDVKNFWSTRQKRILRALQRPKMPSGSTDASADTSDLSKDPTMADFGGFQVHSPSGAASLIGSGMGPHFIFAEGDSEFRCDHASDSSLRHSHHSLHHHHRHHSHNSGGPPLHQHSSFHAMDGTEEDVLSSHKLSDPTPLAVATATAGEMVVYAGEKELTSSMEMKETKPSTTSTYLHQPLSVALPCVTMASRNSSSTTTTTTTTTQRSIKRRPRSRRDTRSTILSCFEQQPVAVEKKADPCCCINNINHNNHSNNHSNNDGAIPDNNNNPNNFCNPNSRPSHPTSFTLTDSQQNSSSSNNNNNNNTTTTTATTNTTNTNNGNPNNNYLEFLLQSDGSLMQSVQIFSPEFPLFLTNNHQWEKLPMLYSEDASLYGGCNTKDNTDSCSPDSVITNFTADVFDSLEPLNSTPSEWWVAQ